MINENEDKTLAVVGMDFRGAFDTVKHESIIRALKRKNFGPKFIHMVATLLIENESTIIVNGRVDPKLEKVKVKRSARQGDPLSPFLFILVIDELLELIYRNQALNGVNINKETIKGLAFADDNYTALINSHDNPIEDQINELMKQMRKFKNISGLDINVSKSEILTNDELFKNNVREIRGIEIKLNIKALGVAVGKDVNLGDVLEQKINHAIEYWNKRNLNYIEKIDLVNYIIIPKVIHILRHCVMNKEVCKSIKKSLKRFVFGGCKKVGKEEIIHSNVKDGGWGLRCFEVVWAQTLMRWTLRSLEMGNTTTLKSLRNYMDENTQLDTHDPESTGHRNTIRKNSLYSCENLWENAYKITGWTIQKILSEKICFDHQPLLFNKLITKQGKMLRNNNLPEIDFGPITNVESLKENRVEIFGDRCEQNKTLTRKIFLNLSPTAPQNLPPCNSECRPPMRSLMSSKKIANAMIRCLWFNGKLDTGIKVKASLSAYTGENMNQPNLKEHLRMSNPKNNLLLNDRCTLLRMKIRFRIFYAKLDLHRMKINEINDSDCSYCITLENPPQKESLRHLLHDCKMLQVVWKHFRKEINSKWRVRYTFLEMVNGPLSKDPGKLKSEYVFLRIINRFTGIRAKDGMEVDPKEKLIGTCDDAIRVVEKIFDKKLKVSLGEV